MTERESRRRRVDLSVLAGSALILGCSAAVAAREDARAPAPRVVSEVARDAPVPGLVAAPVRPRRHAIRRSRAS
jgi:hypothetical protein